MHVSYHTSFHVGPLTSIQCQTPHHLMSEPHTIQCQTPHKCKCFSSTALAGTPTSFCEVSSQYSASPSSVTARSPPGKTGKIWFNHWSSVEGTILLKGKGRLIHCISEPGSSHCSNPKFFSSQGRAYLDVRREKARGRWVLCCRWKKDPRFFGRNDRLGRNRCGGVSGPDQVCAQKQVSLSFAPRSAIIRSKIGANILIIIDLPLEKGSS